MGTLFRILLAIPQALMGAFVFSNMWQWFIVRKFPSLPSLTTLDAVGVLMVAGFPLISLYLLELKKEMKEGDKEKKLSDNALGIILSIVTTLFIYPFGLFGAGGWHQFIH